MTQTSREEREFVSSLKKRPLIAYLLGMLGVLLVATLFFYLRPKDKTASAPKTPSSTTLPPTQPNEITCSVPDPPVGVPLIYRYHLAVPDAVTKVAMQTVSVIASIRHSPTMAGCTSVFGTGFIVSPGRIVTVAHLLWDEERLCHITKDGHPTKADYVMTVICDGTRHRAKIIARDDRRDIMVLSAPECDGTTLIFGSPANQEKRLYATGYTYSTILGRNSTPQAPSIEVTGAERYLIATRTRNDRGWCRDVAKGENKRLGLAGLMRNNTVIDEDIAYLATNKALVHGNSGSPILTQSGKVIGMFVILNQDHDYSCAVSGDEILKVLKSTTP